MFLKSYTAALKKIWKAKKGATENKCLTNLQRFRDFRSKSFEELSDSSQDFWQFEGDFEWHIFSSAFHSTNPPVRHLSSLIGESRESTRFSAKRQRFYKRTTPVMSNKAILSKVGNQMKIRKHSLHLSIFSHICIQKEGGNHSNSKWLT